MLDSLGHGGDVAAEVLCAELVVQQLVDGQVVLALQARAVLGDVDLRVAVALRQPAEQGAEAGRVRAQPEGLRLRADAVAVLALEERLEVAEEVVGVGGRGLVLDVVGGVVVHAVEVVGALDEGGLGGREGRQAVAELLHHRRRVVPEVDRVGEPGDGELDLAIARLDVFGVL